MAYQQSFKIVVIAMDTEHKRRSHAKAMLNELGLEFDFLDATKAPQNFREAKAFGYNSEKAKLTRRQDLSFSEIACHASHRRCWEFASHSRQPTLILESDAQIDKNTIKQIENCITAETPWELVMLYYHKCVPSFWNREKLDSSYRLVKFANRKVLVTSTYLVSPTGAEKLLNNAKEIYIPVDNYVCGNYVEKNITLHAIYPCPCELSEHSFVSSLEADRQKNPAYQGGKPKTKRGPIRNIGLKAKHFGMALKKPQKGL